MKDSAVRPPLAARLLLRLILPGAVRAAVAGDLLERFHREAEADLRTARRAYWRDVLSPTLFHLRREVRGMPLPPGSSPGSGRGDGIVSSLFTDFRFAVRTLAKAPAFTAIAVLSLALGIGPNTAIFSLVSSVLFQDWGVSNPEEVIDIYTLTDDGEYFFSHYSTYELVAEGTTEIFEAVTQHSMFAGRIEGTDGESELVLGEMVAGNYFEVMGVNAALGRTFVPEEDATLETHPVLLVSDDFWKTRYGADPGLLGREIRLNGRPYTVIGITPPEFRGRMAPGIGSDFWVPFSMYPHLSPGKVSNGDLTITGRVRDGVAPGQAIAAVETVATRFDERMNAENPDRRSRFQLAAVSLDEVLLHPNFDGVLKAMAALLFAAVGLVLLIACVNLAGFLLSRAMERRKEMAVRVAMGAGRTAIIRQLVVESLVLSGMGAALGLAIGQVAVRALTRVRPPIPIPLELEIGLNLPLLAFTAGTAIIAAVLFGLAPALEATRAPVAATLRDEAGSSGGRRKVGARGILVASQMALSTVLLFMSVLFLRSLQSASDMELGFDTRDGAVVTVATGTSEYTADEREAFVDELTRRLESQATVAAFGFTGRMPLDLGVGIMSFDIPGVDPPPNQSRHRLERTRITPGYFSAMGIDVLEGRAFEPTDRTNTPNVVILSQAAAQQYWPGERAEGRVLYRGGDPEDALTVVGVVESVKIWSLNEPPKPYAYLPFHQGEPYPTFSVAARGTAAPADLAALIRDEARAIDPDIFLTEVKTIEEHLGYIYFLPRTAALLMTAVGLLALVLACIGLYGMVSYGASRRAREMGIRLAIGADRRSVIGLVLKGGMMLVALGGVVGIVVSLGLGRILEQFLYGVGGLDPLALVAAPLLLAGIAGLAAYLPARRASRVDPVQALRSD